MVCHLVVYCRGNDVYRHGHKTLYPGLRLKLFNRKLSKIKLWCFGVRHVKLPIKKPTPAWNRHDKCSLNVKVLSKICKYWGYVNCQTAEPLFVVNTNTNKILYAWRSIYIHWNSPQTKASTKTQTKKNLRIVRSARPIRNEELRARRTLNSKYT